MFATYLFALCYKSSQLLLFARGKLFPVIDPISFSVKKDTPQVVRIFPVWQFIGINITGRPVSRAYIVHTGNNVKELKHQRIIRIRPHMDDYFFVIFR